MSDSPSDEHPGQERGDSAPGADPPRGAGRPNRAHARPRPADIASMRVMIDALRIERMRESLLGPSSAAAHARRMLEDIEAMRAAVQPPAELFGTVPADLLGGLPPSAFELAGLAESPAMADMRRAIEESARVLDSFRTALPARDELAETLRAVRGISEDPLARTVRESLEASAAALRVEGLHDGLDLVRESVDGLFGGVTDASDALRRSVAEQLAALRPFVETELREEALRRFGLPEPLAGATAAAIASEVAAIIRDGLPTAGPTEAEVGGEDAGDVAAAGLSRAFAALWNRLVERVPELDRRRDLAFLVINLLFNLALFGAQLVFNDRSQRESLAADERGNTSAVETAANTRAMAEGLVRQMELRAILMPARYRLDRAMHLREDPDSTSRALAKLPPRTEVVVRTSEGRWVYVDVWGPLPGGAAEVPLPISGWVYRRGFRPVRAETTTPPEGRP